MYFLNVGVKGLSSRDATIAIIYSTPTGEPRPQASLYL